MISLFYMLIFPNALLRNTRQVYVFNIIILSIFLMLSQNLKAAGTYGVISYKPSSNCILRSLVGNNKRYKKKLNGKQRAIEFETSLDMILKHTTTFDGTLGGFFKGPNPIDPNFEEWFKSRFGENFKNKKWNSLQSSQQKEILDKITKYQEFFKSRIIPGLMFKPEKHPFLEFENYVELGSPKEAGNVNLIEIHLRGEERASELALKVRKAARKKGVVGGVSLHAHTPFKIRIEKLKENPMVESAKHADFYRRTELFSQFTSVMSLSDDLKPIKESSNAISFQKMSGPAKLINIWFKFYNKGINPGAKLDLFEKNYVGIRGEDIYDQPDLWGIEIRSLNKKYDDKKTKALLDGIESSGLREDFGLDPNQLEDWLGELFSPTSQIREFSNKLYPDYSKSEVVTKHLFPEEIKVWKKLKFKKSDERWKFIMHDWSRDLLFYNDLKALEKIRMARIRAMRRHLKNEDTIEIARAFLIESGIYKTIGESLGVKVLN